MGTCRRCKLVLDHLNVFQNIEVEGSFSIVDDVGVFTPINSVVIGVTYTCPECHRTICRSESKAENFLNSDNIK